MRRVVSIDIHTYTYTHISQYINSFTTGIPFGRDLDRIMSVPVTDLNGDNENGSENEKVVSSIALVKPETTSVDLGNGSNIIFPRKFDVATW